MRHHRRLIAITGILLIATASFATLLQSNHRARHQGAAPVEKIVIAPNGDMVAVCRALMVSAMNGDRGDFTLYHSSDLESVFSIAGGPMRDAAFVTGQAQAVILEANTVKLIDLKTQRELWTHKNYPDRLRSVAVLTSVRLILAAESGHNGGIALFSLDDGKLLAKRDHALTDALFAAANGDWYSLGNGKLRKWHATDEKPIAEVDVPQQGVTQQLAQLPSGDLIVAVSEQPIRIHHSGTLELRYSLNVAAPIGFKQLVTVPGEDRFILVTSSDFQTVNVPDGAILATGTFPFWLSACAPQLLNRSLIVGYNSRRLQQTVEIYPIE